MALRSARRGVSAARYDAAEARVKVAEALTDVSDDFSDLLAEVWASDERPENMEARADALDELVEVGVLTPATTMSQVLCVESHSGEVESLLGEIKGDVKMDSLI